MSKVRRMPVVNMFKFKVDKCKGVCTDTVRMFKVYRQESGKLQDHIKLLRGAIKHGRDHGTMTSEKQLELKVKVSELETKLKKADVRLYKAYRQLVHESSMPIRMSSRYTLAWHKYNTRPAHLPSVVDCVPRTAVLALRLTYENAYAELAEIIHQHELDEMAGHRLSRKYAKRKAGTPWKVTREFFQNYGWEIIDFNQPLPFNEVAKDYREFVAHTGGHVGYVKNQVLYDTFDWRFEWFAYRARETMLDYVIVPPSRFPKARRTENDD